MKDEPDFGRAEVPLIPGELYGMRSFQVHPDGRLGPLHRSLDLRYKAGVHIAECDYYDMWDMQVGGNDPVRIRMLNPIKRAIHAVEKIPTKDCQCGFYAYFDGTNENIFLRSFGGNHVNGIVRATGRCIVGDKGFRAEKMEIVALVCDYGEMDRRTRLNIAMREITENLAKIPFWAYVAFFVPHMALATATAFSNIAAIEILSNMTSTFIWAFIIVHLATLVFMRRAYVDTKNFPTMPSIVLAEKIKEQYPDVEFFASMEDARARFPLSKATDLPT